MTARCLGAGWAADRDSVNAASASPGWVSLTATSARYPASLAWSNGNTHGQGGGSVRRSWSMALAARVSGAVRPSHEGALRRRDRLLGQMTLACHKVVVVEPDTSRVAAGALCCDA